jgi:hypothetical protein
LSSYRTIPSVTVFLQNHSTGSCLPTEPFHRFLSSYRIIPSVRPSPQQCVPASVSVGGARCLWRYSVVCRGHAAHKYGLQLPFHRNAISTEYVFHRNCSSNHKIDNNLTVVAEAEDSTPLILNPAIDYCPKTVTSLPPLLPVFLRSILILSSVSFLVSLLVGLQDIFPSKFCVRPSYRHITYVRSPLLLITTPTRTCTCNPQASFAVQ